MATEGGRAAYANARSMALREPYALQAMARTRDNSTRQCENEQRVQLLALCVHCRVARGSLTPGPRAVA